MEKLRKKTYLFNNILNIKVMILYKDSIISDHLCNELIHFLDNNPILTTVTDDYSEGANVICTSIVLSNDLIDKYKYTPFKNSINNTIDSIYQIVDQCINTFIKPTIQEMCIEHKIYNPFNCEIGSTPYQLRKIIKPTRVHCDEVKPIVENNKIISRIASIILTLNDNNDTIHFPFQNIDIKLGKGSCLFFPPYWNYPHYTSKSDDLPRYSIQLWLTHEKYLE